MAEIPKTYIGYGDETDAEGKVISSGTKEITRKTGQDANEWVNPDEVKAALEELKNSMSDGMSKIQSRLSSVAVDADGNMLSIEDATMHPKIEAAATAIGQVPASIDGLISEVQNFAQQEHDKKQIEWNKEAEATVRGTHGVTKVVEA